MSNSASSRSLSSSGYYDARLGRQQLYFPFHSLPHEIIAEIFVLCLPDIEDALKSIKSKNAAPLLLCNVSSLWRSLALGIPHLWNELSIRIANPKVDIELATAVVDGWIARSGELPLSLRLHCYGWNEQEKATAMVKAHLDVFFRYASRWESVDIFSGDSSVSFPKFGPTPLLRKFSYSTPWRDCDPCPFTSCPLLSTFSWPFSCTIASNPNIPWHQLTHITLETDTSTHQILDILRTCQMLVEFNVEVDYDSPNQVQPLQTPVENRSLCRFHICTYITCSGLLRNLILPALTDFSLQTDFESLGSISTRSVHTQLLHLFTRSRCQLEKLKLENCGFNDAGILECLKHDSCSSLMELEISNDQNRPMFTDRVILALTNQGNLVEVNGALLPKLSCLSLIWCLSASPGVLGDMAFKRRLWDNDDKLKSLTLLVMDLDDTDITFLDMAEKMGLDLDINCRM